VPTDFFPTSRDEVETLVRDLMDQATDESGNPLFEEQDRPGSPSYNMREIWTQILQSAYRRMDAAVKNATPIRAEGQGLDRWAEFFGMSRTGAQPASGTMLATSEVTGNAAERLKGTRRIPNGTELRIGSLRVETTESAQLPKNGTEVELPVRSIRRSSGTIAERGATAEFITDATLAPFLDLELLTPLSGGQAAESDQQLRVRFRSALRTPSSAEGIRARLLGLSEVSDVEITQSAYGPGTVEAYVIPTTAAPEETVRQKIENIPTGPANLHVVFPHYEAIALKVDAPGASRPKQVVVDYINNVPTGGSIVISQLESRLLGDGASDARVLGLKRGKELDDGSFKTQVKLEEVTNISARSERSRFVSRTAWVTLCNAVTVPSST